MPQETSLEKRNLIKVVISGDRNYYSKHSNKSYAPVVMKVIRKLAQKHGTRDLLIIQGGAPGVDTLVRTACEDANVHCAEVRALWDSRHQSAGPQRNEIMALMQPDEIIGIHERIEASKGTANMLKIAEKLGIPTRLVGP